MSLSIVLVRRDAEKLKFFSFAASLKRRVADDVEKKNAYHIWFAATGRQEKRDKCESTFRRTNILPLRNATLCNVYTGPTKYLVGQIMGRHCVNVAEVFAQFPSPNIQEIIKIQSGAVPVTTDVVGLQVRHKQPLYHVSPNVWTFYFPFTLSYFR